MSRLIKELKFFARKVGGSHKTCHDRIRIAGRLGALLLSLNIQVKSLSHLKAKHVEHYVDARLSQGIAKRTVQNEMSALRNIFRMAGREKLETSPRLSNQALGLSGTSRAGTKQAIPDATFQVVYQKALERDAGFAVTLKLARLLGVTFSGSRAMQCFTEKLAKTIRTTRTKTACCFRYKRRPTKTNPCIECRCFERSCRASNYHCRTTWRQVD